MSASGWIDEFVTAINAFDGGRVANFFAVDGLWEDASLGLRYEGRDRIARMVSEETPEFSADHHTAFTAVFSDETGFALEWRMTGTHDESGRPFDVRGASIGTLRGGEISTCVDYWDAAQLGRQIRAE